MSRVVRRLKVQGSSLTCSSMRRILARQPGCKLLQSHRARHRDQRCDTLPIMMATVLVIINLGDPRTALKYLPLPYTLM